MRTPLANQVLDAYGGEPCWRRAQAIRATVSASGWALRLKFQHPDDHVQVQVAVDRPWVSYCPSTKSGLRAVLDGQTIRLEDESGLVVEQRSHPKQYFPYGRRALWWDALDRAYFSAYALWNYLAFPALLLRHDIEWTQTAEDRLEARFPESLPTHSERQTFSIDRATGLLRRHDYTAEVFGKWARAVNAVRAHAVSASGIPYPSHRVVTPLGPGGRPLPVPVLVEIRIHDWELLPG